MRIGSYKVEAINSITKKVSWLPVAVFKQGEKQFFADSGTLGVSPTLTTQLQAIHALITNSGYKIKSIEINE